MPGGTVSKDKFANIALLRIIESAANTLTYAKLETGVGLNEKVAWVLHRAEYHIPISSLGQFNSTLDNITFGLSVTNVIADMNTTTAYGDAGVIDWHNTGLLYAGAAASGFLVNSPQIMDFSALPGGGLIVPPVPFYGFVQSTGSAGASTVLAKLYYTTLQMSTDDYWELVQARRVLSV